MPPSLSQTIPTFYFPRGCPKEKVNIDAVIAKIERTFSQFPNERATLDDMGKVAKVRICWLASFNTIYLWKGNKNCALFSCVMGFHFQQGSASKTAYLMMLIAQL